MIAVAPGNRILSTTQPRPMRKNFMVSPDRTQLLERSVLRALSFVFSIRSVEPLSILCGIRRPPPLGPKRLEGKP